jgi:hypothetical protein
MPHRSNIADNKEPGMVSSEPALRASVLLIAAVEQSGKPATRHRVRNLSSSGLRIDHAGGLQPGELVSITVGAIAATAAVVVWVGDYFAGLAFKGEIDPEALALSSGHIFNGKS